MSTLLIEIGCEELPYKVCESVIRQLEDCSPEVLVIVRGGDGAGPESASGRGSSLTAVRSWLTVATAASCA